MKIYANNNWEDKAGNIIWPPNRGLDGEAVIETLKPGTRRVREITERRGGGEVKEARIKKL